MTDQPKSAPTIDIEGPFVTCTGDAAKFAGVQGATFPVISVEHIDYDDTISLEVLGPNHDATPGLYLTKQEALTLAATLVDIACGSGRPLTTYEMGTLRDMAALAHPVTASATSGASQS